jgi:hypothetical protein
MVKNGKVYRRRKRAELQEKERKIGRTRERKKKRERVRGDKGIEKDRRERLSKR